MIPFSYVGLEAPSHTAPGSTPALELTDLIEYALVSYAPTIAPVNPIQITGSMPYTEVVDELTVDVLGSTPAICTANLERLLRTMEGADQWFRGITNFYGDIGPLLIVVEVQGSTVGRLGAAIVGYVPDDTPATVNPEFDQTYGRWVIRGVSVRFRRRGAWYAGAIESASEVFSPISTDGAAQVTLSGAGDALAPIAVNLDLSTTTGVPAADTLDPSVIVVCEGLESGLAASRGFALLPMGATGATGAFTQVADAANIPFNSANNVLRFTPATANPSTSNAANAVLAVGPNNLTDLTIAVYATVRTNTVSTAVSFLVKPRIAVQNTIYTGRGEVIACTSTDPRVVSLGLITIDFPRNAFIGTDLPVQLVCEAIGGTGVTLDFDALLVVNLSAGAAVLRLDAFTTPNTGSSNQVRVAIDPSDRYSTMANSLIIGGATGIFSRSIRVYAADGNTNPAPLAWSGDIPIARGNAPTNATYLAGAWLACEPPYWVYVPTVARVSHRLTFSRRRAYRVPR